MSIFLTHLLGYERVYLPLSEVVDTPFYIQGDKLYASQAVKHGKGQSDTLSQLQNF